MGNLHSLLNAVVELINGVVVTRVLSGSAKAGEVLVTAVDFAGSLSDAVGDARIDVVGQLLGDNGAEGSQENE